MPDQPEIPDFDQMAEQLVASVESHVREPFIPIEDDPVRETVIRQIGEQLRQVWNARGAADLEAVIADVEQRNALKLRIANAEGDSPFGTASAIEVARQLVADCKGRDGVLQERHLVEEVTKVVVLLYSAQGRLPLFRDVVTGKVSDR